ncbi:PD-(D/E)XK nuclease family protein [Lysinibacillus sphaericus]|nr:PD-(D/E)XK nuclease family protein [Lysinibacillus sphaericus]MDM5350272.1 PD-(D/E)XK nuclease family protein [Lysinibacillus sphaericus]
MTQYSFSRVPLFEDCPYHFKLQYIDKLTELPNYDATNALTIGKALHTGIEHNVQTALDYYYNSFPVLTDRMVEKAIKLEILIPKVQAYGEDGIQKRTLEDIELLEVSIIKLLFDITLAKTLQKICVSDIRIMSLKSNMFSILILRMKRLKVALL